MRAARRSSLGLVLAATALLLVAGFSGAAFAETTMTVRFTQAPQTHDRSNGFDLHLEFSAEPASGFSYRTVQSGLFDVSGGRIARAWRRVAGQARVWGITVVPDGAGDVILASRVTTDCAAAHAVCDADGRMLAEAVEVTIADTPLTAWFKRAPAEHNGSSVIFLGLNFTQEPTGLDPATVQSALFDVAGGSIVSVSRRQTGRNDRWTLGVRPDGLGDLILASRATTDCAAAHAVCDAAGRMFTGNLRKTIPGPPALFVADATATEGEGATLDFTVTLSRAVDGTVSVNYATADGTATGGADYTSTSRRLTFRPGETARTISVPVLADTEDDGGETLTLTLSRPNLYRVKLGDATATGTIVERDETATPVVPAAPTGVTATLGDGEVVLAWTAGLDNGSPVTGWQVRRSTDGGATWGPIWTDIPGSDATTTSHTVTGLSNGTAYTFQLRAANARGAGAASPPVTALLAWAPGAPSGVTATPGDGVAVLAWTAGPDNHSPVTRWQQRRSTDGGATWNPGWTDIPGSGAATIEHRVTGLANGTAYSFQLRAVNGVGDGAASGLVTATPVPVPAAPTGLTARAGDGQVMLSWTAGADNGSAVIKWQLRRSADGGTTWDPGWTDIAGSGASTTSHTVTGLVNGTAYRFQLRAVNGSGPGAASATSRAATPRSGLVNPPPPDPVSPGTVSGTLAGTLAVNQFGAATYEIPIEVPPGTAGVEPSLSLAYASNGGNGLLGAGWSLGGLSAIGRCPKTPAQDDARGAISYDADDRFCLDGRRLVAVSGTYGADGTEYRTEIDGFGKIVSHGSAGTGPAWFQVQTKSGQTMQYGNTADSRIEAVDRAEARQWALNRVTDAVGNYLTMRYREEDGQGYPDRIDYTGHDGAGAPYASVRFAYETRHDARLLAAGGSTLRIDERLTHVRTYHGETLVSEYRLTYASDGLPHPSRVTSVERCDGDGACLPATSFVWNGLGDGTLATAQGGREVAGDFSEYRPLQGDFDGDGVTDLAWAHARNGGLRAYVALGEGDGSFATAQKSDPKTSGNFSGYEPLVGDFDGDGLSDIVWTKADSSGLRAWVALGAGDGNLGAAEYFRPRSASSSGYEALVGDFDGDGISDLAWTHARNGGLRAYVALGADDGSLAAARQSDPKTWGNFSGYEALAGDFDGDGLTDIVWTKADSSGLRAYAALGGGDGSLAAAEYSRPRAGNHSDYKPLVGDFNGDGIADLAWTKNVDNGSYAYTALGEGDGTFAAATYSVLRSSRCQHGCSRNPTTGDFNGDGLADIAWLGTRYWRKRHCGFWSFLGVDCWYKNRYDHARAEISLSEGDGGFASARVYEHYKENYWSGYVPLAGDFDGDGVSDVAWTKPGSDGIYAHTALNEAPVDYGRVSSISSASGPAFSLDYAPLTDDAVYVKDSGDDACALPCLDVRMPLQVVREAVRDHGPGLAHSTAYRYGGAKVNLEGRGLLGFRWMEATDGETGVVTSTEYRQDFPYIGQVSASSRFLADETALSVEENSFARLSLNDGKTVFPYISTSVAETYEIGDGPGNDPVATVTTTSAYDTYGNPTAMRVTTAGAGGSFVKRTANSYTNDVAHWHLGRLTCARVTSEVPGQAARTRVSGFAYDAATGLLTREVVEPGAGDVSGCVSAAAATGITLVTEHAHDRYGNRTGATVSGPGIAARTTATSWGERAADGTVTANGRFAVGATNALGHAEKRWHEPAYGKAVRLRGPNGLETAWRYDGFGRAVRETRADGTETVTERLPCSAAGVACPAGAVRAVRVRASGAAPALRYLDRRGLELRIETAGFDGRAVYSDSEYDALGRAVRKSRPYFAGGTPQWTALAYDAASRPTTETRPDGSRTEVAHDGLVGSAVRQRVKVFPAGAGTADSDARITTRDSDALGRLVKVTDPLGNSTTYVRDAHGNLTKTTDASGNAVTLTWDIRGRKTAMDDPDMGRWSYVRNALGELVSQTNARGQTASMSYDRLGRMTRRVEPEGTTTWSFDGAAKGIGKPHLVSAPGGYRRVHAYDALGRPEGETLTIAGERFRVARSYDALGRVATLSYPGTGVSVGRSYTSRGHLEAVYDAESPATVYWRAAEADPEGRVTEAALGNGVSTTRTWDAATGLPLTIQSGLGETSGVQDLGYVFDSLGNLTTREDFIQGVYESFSYDRLNRLTGGTVYDASDDTARATKTYRYDAIGNILNKSDVGAANYVYGSGNDAGAGDAGPHAVVSAGGQSYAYDDNGNMVSGAGRTLVWTSFDKPARIADAATTTGFAYGADRERVVQRRVQGAVTTEIKYVAGLFERVRKTGQATKSVHYVFAGRARIAIRTTDDAPTPTDKLRYLHRDHLGSTDTVTDESGAVLERLSYDAFGKRRIAAGENAWTDPALAISAVETPRGFTGHEHLDDFRLVHMNGRVQDPHLGRFLSADPFVQLPDSTQGLNRYAYAANNPLSFTDPSGYLFGFIAQLFKPVRKLTKWLLRIPIVNAIANIANVVLSGYCGPAAPVCAALGSAGLTAAAGGDVGDIVRASAIAFASAQAFQYIGHGMPLPNDPGLRHLAKTLAHGVVGGVRSVASGGKFGPGFLSAGFAQLAAPASGTIGAEGPAGAPARVIAAAVVGGTASKLGGGKFANGAVTAAFMWMYNHQTSDSDRGDAHGERFVEDEHLPREARRVLAGNRELNPETGQVTLEMPKDWLAVRARRGGGILVVPPEWVPGTTNDIVRIQPPGTGSWRHNPDGYYVVYNSYGEEISPYSGRRVDQTKWHNHMSGVKPWGWRQ